MQNAFRVAHREANYSKMKIVNVVCTITLSKRLSLYSILTANPDAKICRRKLHMLVLKRSPTFLVFASGKLVCTGAKSVADAKRAIKKFVGEIKSRVTAFKVVNLVGSYRLPFTVNRISLQTEGAWLHDHFAGSTFFMGPKKRLIVFTSGAVIITGVQSEDELLTLWNKMYPVLYKHRISYHK